MKSIIAQSPLVRFSAAPLLFLITGMLPVTCIALHCLDIVPLGYGGLFLVLPSLWISVVFSYDHDRILQLVLRGWISGVVAVFFYDLSRIPFVFLGWDDFIPNISTWLMPSGERSPIIGYTWRYIGNGGGLGISFFMLGEIFGIKKYAVGNAVTFGLTIFIGLLGLLLLHPEAQQLMFELTPVAFVGGLTGHIVYGFVLGKMHNWLRAVRNEVTPSTELASLHVQKTAL